MNEKPKKNLTQNVEEHFENHKNKARQELLARWKKMDDKILRTRDKKLWELRDKREKSIWSKYGIITFTRRRYVNTQTRKQVFLLDEKLGIPKHVFVLPEDRTLAIKNFHKYRSYREIANNEFNGEISAMTIHNFIKEQNTYLDFKGSFKTKDGILWINADGLHLKLNRTKQTTEVKNFCFFSGREKITAKKYKLQNRNLVSFINTSSEEILRVLKEVIGKYQNVQEVRVIGDGARWIKNIANELDANFYIDKFHIKKTIHDVFKDRNQKRNALSIIEDKMLKTFEKKKKLLDLAADPKTGEIDKVKLRKIGYLINNSGYYINSCTDKSVGVIEAIHAHFIAKFLKRQRRGFSVPILQNILVKLNNWFNWERYQQKNLIYI